MAWIDLTKPEQKKTRRGRVPIVHETKSHSQPAGYKSRSAEVKRLSSDSQVIDGSYSCENERLQPPITQAIRRTVIVSCKGIFGELPSLVANVATG